MKRILFYMLVLLNVSTNGQNFYEKIFYNQHGTACAREDSAGNIIVAFPEDSIIIKYDSLLNPIWTKPCHFSTYVFEILDNGNLICGGYKLIGSLLYTHMALLDPNGDTIWTRTPVASSQKGVFQMKIDLAGNVYFEVFQIPNLLPQQLFKMDLNGNILGSTYSGNGNDFHFNIIKPNLIVAASTNSWARCEVDGYDSTLTHLWNNTLLDTTGNPHTFRAGVVFPNTNNHVIVGGWWDWYTSLFDLTSSQLNNITTLAINGSFSEVIQISNGSYFCIGNTNLNKGFAMRFDLNWQVEFNGINGVTAKFVQQANDGGFIISGSTTDSSSNKIPWMIKLDQYGSLTTEINEINNRNTFQVNTFNNSFEVTQTKGNKLIIYDMQGRIVRSIENISNKFSFDFFEKSGIYLFALYNGNRLLESIKVCSY